MRYLSLFSGIEACTVAWKSLGWECVAVAEIDPFPCAVLSYHYPNTPNLGDVTQITEQDIKKLGQVDLVVFGSPCQDLSIAGNRQGLAGKSSGLFYEAVRIIQYAKKHNNCRFAIWENVPGAFSSNKGNDFTEVVRTMADNPNITTPKNGWGNTGFAVGLSAFVEWRVLDAQYFGVPQRRRRVFVVADFGDWRYRQPILLECKSLQRHIISGREKRQTTTNPIEADARKASQCYGITADITPKFAQNLCGTLRATGGGGITPPLVAYAFDARQSFGTQLSTAYTLCASDVKGVQAVYCLVGNIIGRKYNNGGNGLGYQANQSYTLTTVDRHAVATNSLVRRLTPVECERLQGFPDNYTKIAYRNKPIDECPDSPRYKALGNSMAVPVMHWIGKRIEKNDDSNYCN